MQQRRELRRRARIIRRFPSSSSSFSSPAPDAAASVRGTAFSSFSSLSFSIVVPTVPTLPTIPTSPILDPLPDTDVRAGILLLSETTPILGSVKIFPSQEPLDVRTIMIDFITAPTSIDSLLVYDGDRRSLGRATLDVSVSGGKRFTLKLLGNAFIIPKREERSVYVRALLKTRDAGGVSGEKFQVKEFHIKGDGVWSNEEYTKTLTETFPTFQTARARFVAIANADAMMGIVPIGVRQRIAAFRFTGERSDGSAELRVTDLTFQVGASSDITLTNARLRGRDADGDHPCTVSSTAVTCGGIPVAHGVIPDAGRLIELFADVTSTGAVSSPFLQVTLNDPGTVDTAGHITWTDGTTTFAWVQFEQPVVRGIRLR